MYKPRCRITGIQRRRIVQGEDANQPGGERARAQRGERARYLFNSLRCCNRVAGSLDGLMATSIILVS